MIPTSLHGRGLSPLVFAFRPTDANYLARWLLRRGAIILEPTDKLERFVWTNANGTERHAILANADNGLYVTSLKTYDILLDYYNNLNKYRPNDTTRRELDTATIRKFLINRDGARCFYCQRYHGQKIVEQLTIEHLIPVAHGGNDTASNLVLACHGCNNKLGNAPLKEKIDYKISLLIGDKHV